MRILATNLVECVSRHPAAVLKSIPCILSNVAAQPQLILQDSSNFCWICSPDYDVIEVYVFLPQPWYIKKQKKK